MPVASRSSPTKRITSFSGVRYRRTDGQLIDVRLDWIPQRDPQGRVVGFVLVATDNRAEQALHEGEERFRQVTDNINEVFWITSPDYHQIFYVSPAYERIWGRSRGSLYAQPRNWIEAAHPDDRESIAKAIGKDTQGSLDIQYRIVRPDGSLRWIRDRSFPVRNERGDIYRFAGIAEDITERKQVENELAKYRDHLKELVAERTSELEESRARLQRSERLASVGTLAAGIAHEINNPLTSILMAVEASAVIVGEQNAAERIQQYLDIIRSEARRSGKIVHSILQFAREEVSNKWPEDVGVVARRARDNARRHAELKGVTLELTVGDGLPLVMMNPTEMQQVFVNCLCNAVDASAPGGNVRVQIEETGDSLRAIISDHGRGMTAEQITRIFDPFYTTRRQQGGTGLGLSITHSIVEQHGGTIDVASEPGRGTTITLVLPAALIHEERAQHAQDPRA
jgi:PAS domain S-box-containing protein